MHDYSLPRGDRDEGIVSPETQPRSVRPANVLAIAGGGYFRAFRRGGKLVTARSIRGAQLYTPSQHEAMEKARRKLKRFGLDSEIVDVKIVIKDQR